MTSSHLAPRTIPSPTSPAGIQWGSEGVMSRFQRLVEQQSDLSRDELGELHRKWLSPRGLLPTVASQIDRLGRLAPMLADLKQLATPERRKQAERCTAFALARSNRRDAVANPFLGEQREELCCMVFGAPDRHTWVERWVAWETIRQGDSEYFAKLIATTRGVVERRVVFQGLLEHYDRLLPVEQSIYPEGYRDVQHAHLEREQSLYGRLELSDRLDTLLRTVSPADLLRQLGHLSDSPGL